MSGDTDTPHKQRPEQIAFWEKRLNEQGMGWMADSLFRALKPLAPIAAQVLWVVQPAFALFGQKDDISALAGWLENPSQTTIGDSPPESE